jgi:hypothetical protein
MQRWEQPTAREVPMILLLMVACLILLDVASLLWGVDSREGSSDPRWRQSG